jgi:hypothetical protein
MSLRHFIFFLPISDRRDPNGAVCIHNEATKRFVFISRRLAGNRAVKNLRSGVA